MKQVHRKWIFFSAMVLILFFLSLCLLYLQIGNNELTGQTTVTKSNTAKESPNSNSPAQTKPVESGPTLVTKPPPQVHTDQQTQLWLISHPEGVRIESSIASRSEFVSHLPWGTIVTGNILETYKSADQPGSSDERLFISYPVAGWLTLSHTAPSEGPTTHSTAYLRPLNTSYTPLLQSTDGATGCADTATHLQHTDFKGGDLEPAQLSGQSNPVKVSSDAQCCTVCCNTPNCVYWTRTEGGDCWLKGLNAVQTPTDKVLTSGVRLKECSARMVKPVSTEYYTSSAVCVVNSVGSDLSTSERSGNTHALFTPVYDTPCADSTNSRCSISSYRTVGSGDTAAVPMVPKLVHILQRERGLSGKHNYYCSYCCVPCMRTIQATK
jgi:hypothetical protein